MKKHYREKIYAGVLGKIIGVYLGRPVEGWSYQRIMDTFGEIPYYVHKECGVPLIVADDDISGTFGFFRALEDAGYRNDISAAEIGNTWLNYIIEDKTILWWGGLGRSTEHTAFLNLKGGIPAPESGSIAQNGRTLAEQIGAQIFIDAFAMACPGDPDRAVDLVTKAASVSHDGLAVDAARYLGAMEAMAFDEADLNKLLDEGLRYVSDKLLLSIIDDVRDICARESDWRKVRAYLDPKYGYQVYPGCCHMVPNHAMVLASLLLGGDDFQRSIMIASSAAWDTDCNAGNVGALNGIRLGLSGIEAGADFRSPVADMMYVVTADGGAVVSDAVQEAKSILRAAAVMAGGEPEPSGPRFSFDFPGATQGFAPCPYGKGNASVLGREEPGIGIRCHAVAEGAAGEVSTPTFIEFEKLARNFSTVASPTLYATQTVKAVIKHPGDEPVSVTPYILYYDLENKVRRLDGDTTALCKGDNQLLWKLPDTEGMPIFRLGFSISSRLRFSGDLILSSVDWTDAPEAFVQKGMLMTSIWNTNPYWTQTWASSAKHFAADFNVTYCVSHPEENGIATMGTRDWADYSVTSRLCFYLHRAGGLVARSRGHRRYYGAVLSGGNRASIIRRRDGEIVELAGADFDYVGDHFYQLELRVKGDLLQLWVDGKLLAEARDSMYSSGGAGYLIDNGTMTADGFAVRAL